MVIPVTTVVRIPSMHRGLGHRGCLRHCSAHWLRKAFLRRMAEAGCSEDYIASISGHRDMDEIRTYVQAANKKRMADEGMAKTLAHFPETGKGTP